MRFGKSVFAVTVSHHLSSSETLNVWADDLEDAIAKIKAERGTYTDLQIESARFCLQIDVGIPPEY